MQDCNPEGIVYEAQVTEIRLYSRLNIVLKLHSLHFKETSSKKEFAFWIKILYLGEIWVVWQLEMNLYWNWNPHITLDSSVPCTTHVMRIITQITAFAGYRASSLRLRRTRHTYLNTSGVPKSSPDWLNYTGFPGDVCYVFKRPAWKQTLWRPRERRKPSCLKLTRMLISQLNAWFPKVCSIFKESLKYIQESQHGLLLWHFHAWPETSCDWLFDMSVNGLVAGLSHLFHETTETKMKHLDCRFKLKIIINTINVLILKAFKIIHNKKHLLAHK